MKLRSTFFSFALAIFAFFFTVPTIQAITFTPQVPIASPDNSGSFNKPFTFKNNGTIEPIGLLIKDIIKYIIGIAGILGTIMLMYGGFLYIMSGGQGKLITDAQNHITSALIGIVLAATSYLILATVNTDLVNFKATTITSIKAMGCCTGASTCSQVSKGECTKGTTFLENGSCDNNVCQITKAETCGVFDATTDTCGTTCNGGKTCENVAKGTEGSKQCHQGVGSPEKYWLCSSILAGGQSCCTTDLQCQAKHGAGYVCNKGTLVDSTCSSVGGICLVPQGDNMPCNADTDCAAPYKCITIAAPTKRCKNPAGNPAGMECSSNADCVAPLKCMGKVAGLSKGICLAGNKGDSCCVNSDCLSGKCSNDTSFFTLCTAQNYYGDVCK